MIIDNRIPIDKICDFAKWLSTKGWEEHLVKGHYEVLRMKHIGEVPKGLSRFLLVHRRLGTEKCTLHGQSSDWHLRWRSQVAGNRLSSEAV